ncbi:MAG: zinc-binding dehydrogenase [SAR202 cluster bacterium]|nr:zinc-binding dehydrogenase [SAR202 cluster bacterium]
MKAVYIQSQGDVNVLQYGDLPDPVIGPGEVKVRVRACALNRLDVFTRLGVRGTKREFKEPFIPGVDVAGDVTEVAPGVRNVKVGDRVVLNPVVACLQCWQCLSGRQDLCEGRRGMLGSAGMRGGYAEYTKAPAANALPIPPSLTYEQAAAMPTTYMPVWNIVVRRAQLRAWETVLALSASSGVGTAAVQVAKGVVGARVIATTSSPEKAAKAKEIGADHVINYKTEDIAERVKEITGGRGADVVVDHVGADFWDKATASLARGGRYGVCGVTTGYRVQFHMGELFSKQLTYFGVTMGSMNDLREAVDAAGRGLVKPVIDRTFLLSQAKEAHTVMEETNFFGKLLLIP